jgi:hypothetical protein
MLFILYSSIPVIFLDSLFRGVESVWQNLPVDDRLGAHWRILGRWLRVFWGKDVETAFRRISGIGDVAIGEIFQVTVSI